jgi:hypothetical protein
MDVNYEVMRMSTITRMMIKEKEKKKLQNIC